MKTRNIPITQRPERFYLNRNSPLYTGLAFAGLGQFSGSTLYHDSACGNEGTLTGYTGAGNTPADRWMWDSNLLRMVLDFNNAGDYVSLGTKTINAGTSHTFSCWLHYHVTCGHIFDCETGRIIFAGPGSVSGGTQLSVYDGTARDFGSCPVGENIQFHLAYVCDGATSKCRCYVNGVQFGSELTYAPTAIGGQVAVGGRYNGAYSNHNGSLSDVLIYQRCLSVSEIQPLADPSNVMLSGLILPPRRRVFASGSKTIRWPWQQRRHRRLSGVA